MTIKFEAEAQEEYRRAALHSKKQFGLGQEFVSAVRIALDLISENPTGFKSAGGDTRVFHMKKFPFSLYYQYSKIDDSVCIYALAHHKRSPGYWKDRLS